MNRFNWIVFVFLLGILSIEARKYQLFDEENSSTSSSIAEQRLLVDVDIYNRLYTLPYLFGQLERLKCPCNECHLDLRIYQVFNSSTETETFRLTKEWLEAMKKSSSNSFKTITIHEWKSNSTEDRADRLRSVMKRSLELSVHYLAMFDSMIILLEPERILSILINKDKPLMAPLLRSTKNVYTSTFYLNEHDKNGLDVYQNIYERKQLGCFLLIGGIKDFYFVNFKYSQIRKIFLEKLINDENQQISTIDLVARENSLPMYVCNREEFGYIPVQYVDALFDEDLIRHYYFHMLIEHQLNGPNQSYLKSIDRSSLIDFPSLEKKTKFGFDEIYVINLKRREDRRKRLTETFDILNIESRFFEAVDGKLTINQNYLDKLSVRLMPNYEDPYNQRPMNFGELGCFLSHFAIWQEIVKKNYVNGAIILEDDVRFDVYFKYKLEKVFSDKSFDWDLIYLGRKIMRPDEENYNQTTATYLIEPSYSHWTVGYAISLRAARILIEENPIQKILPVDEYLPIMFDRHPNQKWKTFFTNRTLKAFAFHPPILTPSHYFGEPNYISDTENTTLIEKQNQTDSDFINVDLVKNTSQIEETNLLDKDEL